MDRPSHPWISVPLAAEPVGEPPYEVAMTRRRRRVLPLPPRDPVIEAMPAALRLEVGRTWQRRAHEELKVASGFTVLCRELLETGAPPEVLSIVSRAVHDEVRHGEVCRAVAERYLGAAVSWPGEISPEPPPPQTDPRLRAAYHVVAVCCVNEAIAWTFLEASLSETRSHTARVGLGDLLADEVLHARAGWIYLACLAAPLRAAIEANLLTLVKPVLGGWWEEGPIERIEGAPEHGIPSLHATRRSAVTALRDIVIPGLERLGLRVEPTRIWLTEREATLGAPSSVQAGG